MHYFNGINLFDLSLRRRDLLQQIMQYMATNIIIIPHIRNRCDLQTRTQLITLASTKPRKVNLWGRTYLLAIATTVVLFPSCEIVTTL